jgi:ATP-binding cassette subfamily B protein
MTEFLNNLCWPLPKLTEAIEELALNARLINTRLDTGLHSAPVIDETQGLKVSALTGRFVETAAEWMGLEAGPLDVEYMEVEQVLRSACPLIIRLAAETGSRFLAIARANKQNIYIVAPDGNTHKVKLKTIRALICDPFDAPLTSDFDKLLKEAGISERRREVARSALLRETLSHFKVCDCWMLRLPPGASFIKQLQQNRLHIRLLVMAILQFIQYLLLIGSWWLIGRGALQGQFDFGWLLAWALLLLTMIPVRLLITWIQGIIAIGVGGLLKQRLLYGALKLDLDAIRGEGSGKLLGRVIESAAVEALATTGGFAIMAAAVEFIVAAFVLSKGAGGMLHAVMFIVWTAISLLIGWRYFKQRLHWTDVRLLMTNDMVERMVGHRTRLAQESPDHWHDGEDQLLARYIEVSRSLDRSNVALSGLIPRGWLMFGLFGLLPPIISGSTSNTSLAISVGGLLLGYGCLGKLTGSLSQATGVAVAWRQVKDLFNAAAKSEIKPSPVIYGEIASRANQPIAKQKILEVTDLVYRYRSGSEPVIQRCDLEVFSGERILLEGPSGGGKSTLASVIVGLRMPDSGLLLLHGLDPRTLGVRGWREQVVASPQFHENHVLTGTLAFNLLMGRNWPPDPDDLEEAKKICEELGLGSLLERMPSGLSQIVGETGWQLSHGERSRLFIARALLQEADLIVLDESFAALDPENLRLALLCVLNRSKTLIVVAHP